MEPRDLLASDSAVLEHDGPSTTALAHRRALKEPHCPPRLLVVHNDEPRFLALIAALADAGYRIDGAAGTEDARRCLDQTVAPDVLVLDPGRGQPMAGIAFARACLARQRSLRILYMTPLPWPATLSLLAQERLLPLPFSEPTLAAALAIS